jgi:hypothetical protein
VVENSRQRLHRSERGPAGTGLPGGLQRRYTFFRQARNGSRRQAETEATQRSGRDSVGPKGTVGCLETGGRRPGETISQGQAGSRSCEVDEEAGNPERDSGLSRSLTPWILGSSEGQGVRFAPYMGGHESRRVVERRRGPVHTGLESTDGVGAAFCVVRPHLTPGVGAVLRQRVGPRRSQTQPFGGGDVFGP